jgi:NAD(P)-dependent dehydrogenase (short-subunit alcohol dehydrogenase family)
MVKLDVVHASNTALVQSQPLVAVFFGGTSGIGSYTVRALARATANGGKGFRAYIVGRNAKAAEEIIAECRGIYSHGEYTFVKANDISLIQDVDRVCAEIIQLEEKEGKDPRIDYLMLSQGGSIFLPRKGMPPGFEWSCGSDNDNRYKRGN